MDLKAFWRDRSVLVTGADGFIGSHVAEALGILGANVRALCYYNSNGSHGWLDGSPPHIKASLDIHLGDIRDSRFVDSMTQGVDTVFHLAALIAIPYSYVAPASFVETNVVGTLNVLEAVKRSGCRRLVHTSTSEVYGTPDQLPISEGHPLKAQSPYAASKIAADKLCESYNCTFATPVVTLRPFNTYGPRQSARAVIPTILSQLLHGRESIKLGRLDPRRDLTFVDDTVEGFLRSGMVDDIEGMTIHLGTGSTTSIGEIFDLACEVTGQRSIAISDETRIRPDNSEVLVLQSDPKLADRTLSWRPNTDLRTGLRATADWVADNLTLFDPTRYQI